MIPKLISSVFLYLVLHLSAIAQTPEYIHCGDLVISKSRVVLYADMWNDLHFNINVPQNNLKFTAEGGKIIVNKNSIKVFPYKKGKIKIACYYKDLILNTETFFFSTTYTVINIPNPKFSFKETFITKEGLIKINELKVKSSIHEYNLKYAIIQGTVIIRTNGKKFTYHLKGGNIPQKLKEIFINLQSGDIIMFVNFYAKREEAKMLEKVEDDFLIIQ
tara:strand:+ start:110748 stop:111401 length:654 start_codon:yes stop_codon:yes gene_type:complete